MDIITDFIIINNNVYLSLLLNTLPYINFNILYKYNDINIYIYK